MNINRREFLILTAAMAVAGCQTADHGGSTAISHGERLIDAGPVGNYSTDGVYAGFRDLGFFIIRKGDKLSALSSYCTHRKCKLTAEPDRSFYCPCHGSTFDPNGRVTHGPARRDLPTLPTFMNEQGRLFVKVAAM